MHIGRPTLQNAFFLLLACCCVLIVLRYLERPTVVYTTLNGRINTSSSAREPQTYTWQTLTDDELIQNVEETAPNLPVRFWKTHKHLQMKLNNTCAFFPKVLDVRYNNLYWQTLVTSNGTFQLLNAYLDDRDPPRRAIRIVGMINVIAPSVKTFCQVWYENQTFPVIVQAHEYSYIWREAWGHGSPGDYEAYLISCPLPKTTNTPSAVSLVEFECDYASNILKVLYNKDGQQKDFAVCVKGLDYPKFDLSVRLAEWIELLMILGADVIHFYKYSVHPNVDNLLAYYEKLGVVKVTAFQLAGEQPNLPALRSYYFKRNVQKKRINEVVPYNDCFYQHMYQYKYVLLLDIDEVILPNNSSTWKELLAEIHTNVVQAPQSSYSAQNLYFLDENHQQFSGIPKYMYMLQHVYRSVNYTVGEYVKSFFSTSDVLTLHNHYPIACLKDCRMHNIKLKYGQLQHYRKDCVNELKKKCTSIKHNVVMDTNIWRYKDVLVEKVKDTLFKSGVV